MNAGLIVTGGIFAAVIGVGVVSYVSAYNTGNRLENQIEATAENNKNILASYGTRIAEAAQVPEMARDDIIEVTTAALEGRYGEDGANSVFLSIQEQNPSVDPALYTQLQRMIESGRTDFQNGQTALIDQTRVYEVNLESLWTGTFLSMAGFPRIDLDDYKIVSTARADSVFETKTEEPIQLR